MKILMVHHQMKLFGGAELVVVQLAKYLQKRGHTVKILAANTALHPEYKGLDIVTPNPVINWRLWSIRTIPSIYRVFKALHKLCAEYADNFDVINAHNFPAIWAVPHNKPVVWMCNEVPDLWHSTKTNVVVNKVFNIARIADCKMAKRSKPIGIVADNRCADIFKKRYNLNPEIIPYGINGEFFAQCQHSLVSRQFRVICPAMISPSKNQLSILQAIKTLRLYVPNVKVVLSGYREPNHPYSLMLDKYIKAHQLDVTYIAPTSREELRAIYSNSSVAVFAGKGQGSWLSPFEQLSMGIPVIVTPNLTCSDLIYQQNIGIVTDDIMSALLGVYHNYSSCKKQALKGQKFVLDNLTWDNYGRKMETILKAACE